MLNTNIFSVINALQEAMASRGTLEDLMPEEEEDPIIDIESEDEAPTDAMEGLKELL